MGTSERSLYTSMTKDWSLFETRLNDFKQKCMKREKEKSRQETIAACQCKRPRLSVETQKSWKVRRVSEWGMDDLTLFSSPFSLTKCVSYIEECWEKGIPSTRLVSVISLLRLVHKLSTSSYVTGWIDGIWQFLHGAMKACFQSKERDKKKSPVSIRRLVYGISLFHGILDSFDEGTFCSAEMFHPPEITLLTSDSEFQSASLLTSSIRSRLALFEHILSSSNTIDMTSSAAIEMKKPVSQQMQHYHQQDSIHSFDLGSLKENWRIWLSSRSDESPSERKEHTSGSTSSPWMGIYEQDLTSLFDFLETSLNCYRFQEFVLSSSRTWHDISKRICNMAFSGTALEYDRTLTALMKFRAHDVIRVIFLLMDRKMGHLVTQRAQRCAEWMKQYRQSCIESGDEKIMQDSLDQIPLVLEKILDELFETNDRDGFQLDDWDSPVYERLDDVCLCLIEMIERDVFSIRKYLEDFVVDKAERANDAKSKEMCVLRAYILVQLITPFPNEFTKGDIETFLRFSWCNDESRETISRMVRRYLHRLQTINGFVFSQIRSLFSIRSPTNLTMGVPREPLVPVDSNGSVDWDALFVSADSAISDSMAIENDNDEDDDEPALPAPSFMMLDDDDDMGFPGWQSPKEVGRGQKNTHSIGEKTNHPTEQVKSSDTPDALPPLDLDTQVFKACPGTRYLLRKLLDNVNVTSSILVSKTFRLFCNCLFQTGSYESLLHLLQEIREHPTTYGMSKGVANHNYGRYASICGEKYGYQSSLNMIGLPDVLQMKVKVVKSDTISAFFAKLEVFLRQYVDESADDVLRGSLAVIFGQRDEEHVTEDAENEILWFSVTIDDVMRHLREIRLICEECNTKQRGSLMGYVRKLVFSPVMKRLCVIHPIWSDLAGNDLDVCQFLLMCIVDKTLVDDTKWADILEKILHWEDENEVLVQTLQPLMDFVLLKLFEKSEQSDGEQTHRGFLGHLIPLYIQSSALGRSFLLSSLPTLMKASTTRPAFLKEFGGNFTGLLKSTSLDEFVNECVPLRCEEEVKKIISAMRGNGVNDEVTLEKLWRGVYDFACGIVSHSLSYVHDDHVGTDLHKIASRFIECNLEVMSLLHKHLTGSDFEPFSVESSQPRFVSSSMEGRVCRLLFGIGQVIERLMGFQSTPEVMDSIRLFHETIFLKISEHGVSSFMGTESDDRHSLRAKTCVCVSEMVKLIHDITEKCGSKYFHWDLFSHLELGGDMHEDKDKDEDEDAAEIVTSWSQRFSLSDLSYFILIHSVWFNNRRAMSLKTHASLKTPHGGGRASVGDSLGSVKEKELDRSLRSCIRQLIDWNTVPKPKRPLLSWFFGNVGMKRSESEEIDVPPIPYLTLRCTECHQEHGFHSLGELESMCVEEDHNLEEEKLQDKKTRKKRKKL
eukprot:TRINITY_DN734_c0_g1_i3.p1 TRINITY_DN734_c0_g1~~TRINITY_DN734_c0_g1_i3.p1  ORF type:complete len:1483 (+),score=413.93 TRINITY_DN734_c0_g1_i3:257-4450(+)